MASEPIRLENFDQSRSAALLRLYALGATAEVRVNVLDTARTYSGLVEIELVVDPPTTSPERLWEPTLEVAVPATRFGSVDTTYEAVYLVELSANQGGRALPTRLEHNLTSSEIAVSSAGITNDGERIHVRFQTLNAFRLSGGSGPLQTWRLAMQLRVANVANIVFYLSHPSVLSLRCRRDSSDYHSLPQGTAPETIRKVGFFSSNRAEIDYLYGSHGTKAFLGLSRLPFAASIGLLSAALSLALLMADLTDMAATALALALLPPVLQAASPRQSFYRSADIHARGVSFWITTSVALVYIPAIVFSLISVTDLPHLRRLAQIFAYVGATLLSGIGCLLVVAVQNQIVPAHYCDSCARRLVWRRRIRVYRPSRRTLCQRCYADALTAESTED